MDALGVGYFLICGIGFIADGISQKPVCGSQLFLCRIDIYIIIQSDCAFTEVFVDVGFPGFPINTFIRIDAAVKRQDTGFIGSKCIVQGHDSKFSVLVIGQVQFFRAGGFVGIVRNDVRLTLGVKIHPEGEVYSHGNVGYSGVSVLGQGGAHDCGAQQQCGSEDQQFLHWFDSFLFM